MSGGLAGVLLAAVFLPVSISTLQVLCVLFPVWVEGFYRLVVTPLGMEGTSLPGLLLRLVFSPGSSVHGVAVLRDGRGLAPPHRHGFPPGQRPLLQVSVVLGDTRMGEVGESLQDPGKGRHIWGGRCLVLKPGWALLSIWPPSKGEEKVAAVLQAPLSSPCSRRYPRLKRSLLLLLLLLLLAAAAYGEPASLDLVP